MSPHGMVGLGIGTEQQVGYFEARAKGGAGFMGIASYYVATLQAEGKECGVQANMLKMVATENAVAAADLGIQIMGGMGYSAETDMQRYWRDHRILRMTPISNEMVRNTIAESLGLPRSF